ncbi:MAG: hypothetical protein M3Q71_19835, partial [Chloroflexota bacterium]|nr:hypothetical protein [Chloroflexota bacterium]
MSATAAGVLHDPLTLVLTRLPNAKRVRDGEWRCACPVHNGQSANSLKVVEGDDGRVLMHCFAGCATEDVLAALDLELSDLFVGRGAGPRLYIGQSEPTPSPTDELGPIVAEYAYTDPDGEVRFRVTRHHPKTFRPWHLDGRSRWVMGMGGVEPFPYRLTELLAADPALTVHAVEGEKDVDNLRRHGLVATCNPGGAGKWRAAYAERLRGRRVAILPDNDEPGRAHAAQVAASLHRIAAEVRIVELPGLPAKGDVSDWLAAGGTADELATLVRDTPCWTPQAGSTPRTEPKGAAWPLLSSVALHGLAGDVVRAFDPYTEADRVATLMSFLVMFGNAVNRGPHVMVGDDRHGTNIFSVLVGETAKARKGTSQAGPRRLLKQADQVWSGVAPLRWTPDHWALGAREEVFPCRTPARCIPRPSRPKPC